MPAYKKYHASAIIVTVSVFIILLYIYISTHLCSIVVKPVGSEAKYPGFGSHKHFDFGKFSLILYDTVYSSEKWGQ